MTEQHGDELRELRAMNPSTDATAPRELRDRVWSIPGRSSPLRRTAWLAAAASALVIGAVGVSTTLDPFGARGPVPLTRPASGEIAPPVNLGDGARAVGQGAADPSSSAVDMVQDASRDAALFWGNRARFTLPVFDAKSGTATVYALDAAPRFNADAIMRAAGIFGVSGDAVPNEYGGGWRVGMDDWTGPSVSLNPWGGGEMMYNSGTGDPLSGCLMRAGAEKQIEDWDARYAECRDSVPMPTEQQAHDAMDLVLRAFDIDADEVLIEILGDEYTWDGTLTIRALRVVDGMATSLAVYVTVSSDGIVSANGPIGDIVSLGSYKIVSPAEAARRLNNSAFAPSFPEYSSPRGLWPQPAIASEPPSTPAPAPAPGSAIPWSIAEYRILSARLGLGTVYGPDGLMYVTPAYEFTDDQGNRWSVTALDEEHLATRQ